MGEISASLHAEIVGRASNRCEYFLRVQVGPQGAGVFYVAPPDDGRQITLCADEFAATYGWKNDSEKIRLSAVAAADNPNGGKAEKAK